MNAETLTNPDATAPKPVKKTGKRTTILLILCGIVGIFALLLALLLNITREKPKAMVQLYDGSGRAYQFSYPAEMEIVSKRKISQGPDAGSEYVFLRAKKFIPPYFILKYFPWTIDMQQYPHVSVHIRNAKSKKNTPTSAIPSNVQVSSGKTFGSKELPLRVEWENSGLGKMEYSTYKNTREKFDTTHLNTSMINNHASNVNTEILISGMGKQIEEKRLIYIVHSIRDSGVLLKKTP